MQEIYTNTRAVAGKSHSIISQICDRNVNQLIQFFFCLKNSLFIFFNINTNSELWRYDAMIFRVYEKNYFINLLRKLPTQVRNKNDFLNDFFQLWCLTLCHRVAKTPPFISIAAVLHKFLQVDRLSWSQIPQDSRFHFTICQGKVCSSHNLGEHAVIKRRPLNTLQTFHLSKIAGMTNLAKEPCYWCRILVEFWWQIFTGLLSMYFKYIQKNTKIIFF